MKSIEVVAAVIRRGDEILAAQRGYGEFKDGWEFPGGKIEPGESPEQALVREIKEELDASITVERRLCDISHSYDDFNMHMQCFVCTLDTDMSLLEHEAVRWLDRGTIDSVTWLPADIKVVEVIKAELLGMH